MTNGYVMIDASGIDISVKTAQSITGFNARLQSVMDCGKPIVICGLTNDGTAIPPSYCTVIGDNLYFDSGVLTIGENSVTYSEITDTVNAALVDLVDGGAKNFCPTNEASVTRRILITFALPAGIYHISFGSLTSTDTDKHTCKIAFMQDTTEHQVIQSPRGTDIGEYVTLTVDCTGVYVYASNTYDASAGDTVSFSDLMICTKAAWTISPAYQPYRPSYQELYERVVALEQAEHSET